MALKVLVKSTRGVGHALCSHYSVMWDIKCTACLLCIIMTVAS